MANPTQPHPEPSRSEAFRTVLDSGQIVEADSSIIEDPATSSQAPAVLLRMTRALAWTLETGAAALGDSEALQCQRLASSTPTAAQRLAAVSVLRNRAPQITALQGVAVIDAAARWLGEDQGEDLAQALLQATCRDTVTANFTYLALIGPPAGER